MTDNELLESHNMPYFGIDKLSRFAYDSHHHTMSKRTYPSIAARMKATGETQVELAAKLGRSQAFVSKLVRRLSQPPLDDALKIAEELRVPVESLVAEAKPPLFPVEK